MTDCMADALGEALGLESDGSAERFKVGGVRQRVNNRLDTNCDTTVVVVLHSAGGPHVYCGLRSISVCVCISSFDEGDGPVASKPLDNHLPGTVQQYLARQPRRWQHHLCGRDASRKPWRVPVTG